MNALLIAASLLLGADPPADGFYRLSSDADAPAAKIVDGRALPLGKQREFAVQSVQLISQNNENDRFWLSVTVPFDADLEPNAVVLIVDGQAFPQTGSGSNQQETSSLHFFIPGEKRAERVATFLNTPVLRCKHPGHRLLVTYTPAEESFAVGAKEIPVTLRIENVGDAPFAFQQGGRNRAARDNQYTFAAYRYGTPVADVGTTQHHGGMSVLRTIQPGEAFEDVIDLRKWFAFDEPGHYDIHGAYYLSFHDPDDEGYFVQWEDHASAEFTVRVEAAEGGEKPVEAVEPSAP
ncbi:hypothetical protein [Alienimonas chondri]|uniref:Uncharacterized protein n=1 Tax=Alienimonas chondri TaxID=2681879 RepID=A0ABX1VKG4_9PLAN|nr:hypothetical protein [Alienimonas chondri]NNJ27632.1 hypothetical protein [Alienimonas chondri]